MTPCKNGMDSSSALAEGGVGGRDVLITTTARMAAIRAGALCMPNYKQHKPQSILNYKQRKPQSIPNYKQHKPQSLPNYKQCNKSAGIFTVQVLVYL